MIDCTHLLVRRRGEIAHGGERRVEQRRRRRARVEHAEAPRLGRRQRVVGPGDRVEERPVLALEAVGRLAADGLPARARGGVHAQQQRAVGRQPASGEVVDRPHGLDAEATAGALVGQRGVDEAVEQHPAAGRHRGPDPLGDELGAGGGVEQRLGARVDAQRRVLDQRADALGELDAARLAQERDVAPAVAQARGETLGERRLARAVEPLDGDEPPAHGRSLPEVLPATERHPHARAVLGGALPPDGRPSHAYLFHGPAGSGKAAVARAFAVALLSDGAPDPDSVRERVEHGVHPDLTWVTPSGAAEMLVSDIDEPVVAAAARTPFEARRRVFVIERAETMNDQAANRMLKTLEEPAAFAHLVLLTDRPGEILPTIASRCQHVRFDAPGAEEIAARLDGIDEATARACARLALGDGERAARLAFGDGPKLRASAEAFARGALHDTLAERPWLKILARAKALGDAAQVVHAVDRRDALSADAEGRGPHALRRAVEEIDEARALLILNPSEELLLEALA